ncbi:MAG: hypothetical protein A3D24_00575 [Candidatus Blackburnbacteria bacterium RIFCSPHIGHO2_02_FULL_39_13]|uniref:Uncharacterized protein n=1 Tax=Candidatus Blackburnbacteria bacterium RIFCSPLOWO2_01_FULL_40_20 TaxID=1797519 RepID=A0A1G1VG27_9BACT|nr:MAG: hypothetical protein UT38_C0003G0032 [Microgenomates group bacterium GW2011_GWA2_39_19]OGY07570.1 MAG: hypothetical protein A2694_04925 [Candidatus Blackburnbacteria bacterium RIFCSPHIGHO2_01_FULL_40_17]OGY08653.1 MAG: hypothetical protein A3D24_00575 [Candidatus Blackburnbacteria bacterium RIFCSPHIGHO2_02_FULL_39_13]OGY14287.1 MAG: hypothetical protein A3A77_02320 [Candidatus Blackburnbacteria bacterium RIFCSPLOWO2_01_FULL_40_20]HBL51947.1 hypothetical protein [Candidatus Blackburnbact
MRKNIFAPILVLLFSFSFLFVQPTFAQTQPFNQGRVEVQQAGNPNGGVATLIGLERIVSNILTIALGLASIVLFIMFVIGGFNYLTASGDPKAVDAAQKTLTHAIAGLVVLVLAYLILLLIKQITGVDVTLFRIYKP